MKPLACWLGQHDWMYAHAPHRIFLQCDVCGKQTPGLRDDYDDLAKPRVIHAAPVKRTFTVVRAGKRRAS